jgi:electron transfer flavoprotein alpha/beta subunit
LKDLNIAPERIGSRTEILDVLAPRMERKKIKITGETVQEVAEKLVKALVQEGVIGRK